MAASPRAVLSITDPNSRATDIRERLLEVLWDWRSQFEEADITGESFCREFIVKLPSPDIHQKSIEQLCCVKKDKCTTLMGV